jgi:outer membrane receptor for ferrienterochelin and colicins
MKQLWIFLLTSFCLHAQQRHTITGNITDAQQTPLAGVWVGIPALQQQQISTKDGRFTFNHLPGDSVLVQFRMLGFRTQTKWWHPSLTAAWQQTVVLAPDVFLIDQVTVTGSRREVAATDEPMLTSQISGLTFKNVQAMQVADGLAFAPGLRLENNCQNCGFTQVRMNGLPGPYTQVLINGRPVFSALAGVYGLEQLPANMVDRVEVVRGGGSVMFGGSAIAGTVNIVTRTPQENAYSLSMNQAFTNFQTSDRSLQWAGSLVNEEQTQGIQFFAFDRNRDYWDANNDGFSEITALNSTSLGLEGFFKWHKRSRLSYTLYRLMENRRGGSDFDRPPHQAAIAEQLQHQVYGAQVQNHWSNADFKHQITTYTAVQTVRRNSYYGAGGRVLAPSDTITPDDLLAINAYGNTRDFSQNTGIQWGYSAHPRLSFVSGTELQSNWLNDLVPGYNRSITQQTHASGTYVEANYKPISWLELLAGSRWESIFIDGQYTLQDSTVPNRLRLQVPLPRMQALVRLHPNWKLRAGWASGYRAPQAFDEDLHIETVGGEVRFILMDPGLRPEISQSFNASLNWDVVQMEGQWHVVVEGFRTRLENPFIVSAPEFLENGGVLLTKRNGTAATVGGVHIEAGYAHKRTWVLNGGFTAQLARYDVPELIWAPEPGEPGMATTTQQLLRTPNRYGFLTYTYTPHVNWTLVGSGIFTGSMDVPHVIDPETALTAIKKTPAFADVHFKVAYTVAGIKKAQMEVFVGLQNAFNSFQRDFDIGPLRDAGYVYGPMRPRTIYFGLVMNGKVGAPAQALRN